ncbi:MAG: carboxypeptidase-like regulatory domain-containing protein [Roseivirga sp.]|nr:carboxypeptidase-like regulatory domain-containing protein [Roseivirga sp.]
MTKLFQKYLFLLMICSPLWSWAQTDLGYTIEGVVSDSVTNETLPFASVFFSGTTFGTTSDKDGNFVLKADRPGTYDLVISFTGYETYFRQVDLNEQQVLRLNVKLYLSTVNLGAVTITAKKDEAWRKNLILFKQTFLGTSANANSCRIVNEEVLNFDDNRKDRIFEAYASEPLIIENKALGYRIKYLLEDFKIYYARNYSVFYGFPSFEELGKKGKVRKRWAQGREKAYLGSISHFFKALYEDKTKEAGFVVNAAKDMKRGRAIDLTPIRMRRLVSTKPNGTTKSLSFENYLYIVYKKEKESLQYKIYQNSISPKPAGKEQLSWIFLPEGITEVDFEQSGYLINPLAVVTNGYWGFEKLGDMVPMDYQPEEK